MGEWQPIETAPKDGTKVDLWDRAGFRWANCHWGCHYFENGRPVGPATWGRGSPDGPQPTHWMPIPEAPK